MQNNGKEREQGAEDGHAPTLISTVFPTQANLVFIITVLVGAALIVLSLMGSRWFSIESYRANMILCFGGALILGAVGSQATIRIGSLILAGSVASAAGLYLLLERERVGDLTRAAASYVRGTLFDVDSRKMSVRIKFTKNVLGSYDPADPQYGFVVFDDDINTTTALVEITDKSDPERPVRILIHRNCFKAIMGTGSRIEWEYRDAAKEISDRARNVVIGKLGDERADMSVCPSVREASARATTKARPWGLISTAFAQQARQDSVDAIVADLKSDDTDTRRGARDRIALLPNDQLRALLDVLHDQYQDYRVKLGICVGLAEILRTDKERGSAISSILTKDDRGRLVDAAGDKDRTVRIYATEFLFDLGDPDVTEIALKRAAASDDQTAQYQWIFLSQDGWRKLSTDRRAALKPIVEQLKVPAGEMARKILSQLTP